MGDQSVDLMTTNDRKVHSSGPENGVDPKPGGLFIGWTQGFYVGAFGFWLLALVSTARGPTKSLHTAP